jgi:hypothetical protein
MPNSTVANIQPVDAVELRWVIRDWKFMAQCCGATVHASPVLIRLNQYALRTPGAEERVLYVSASIISDEYGPRVERKES